MTIASTCASPENGQNDKGYSFNELTDQRIDGRDLWSGRVTLAFNPIEQLKTTLVWEHFSEDDDRMRTSKQLCKTDVPPTSVNGVSVGPGSLSSSGGGGVLNLSADYLSQGCKLTSLYSPDAFEVPYGFSLPYAVALGATGGANDTLNPYAGTTQSKNLRVIQSALNPRYQAKNDTLEFNADYAVIPSLTFTSQSGYNQDFLSSTEDYNRINTSPAYLSANLAEVQEPQRTTITPSQIRPPERRVFLLTRYSSATHNWVVATASWRRISPTNMHGNSAKNLRLASSFGGPLNFSVGGNYLHYETEENYYVFINALTDFAQAEDQDGNQSTLNNSDCLQSQPNGGFQLHNPITGGGEPLKVATMSTPIPSPASTTKDTITF